MQKSPHKLLFIDLEISPNLGWSYDKWETNIIKFEKYQYILAFSYKWFKNDKITAYCLPDFPTWKKNRTDDSELVKRLHEVMCQAEIICAHNAKKFDIKKANTRFIVNGLTPPRPYKVIDTLTVARSKFGFTGNSLNDLCIQLGIGKKKEKTHSDLWQDCLNGDMKAWKHMRDYNIHDVRLLEAVYKQFLPWVDPFPRVQPDDGTCPHCGSSNFQKRGFIYTKAAQAPRYHCLGCGAWRRGNYEKL